MKTLLPAMVLMVLTAPAFAQVGGLTGAEIIERNSIDDPAVAARQTGDGWFAFRYPAIEGTRTPCCWKGNWKPNTGIGCSLDRDFQSYGTMSTAPLEDTMLVYARVRQGDVVRLKVTGAQCPMDAAGQAVTWIGDTDPGDTLDWLERLAQSNEEDRLGHPALWALALHESGDATDRLHSLAREKNSERAGEAIFWLGETRGEEGFKALEDLLDDLPPGDARRQINFALSQNDSDRAPALLADIAHDDRDPEQRGDALFWLAQEYPEEAQPIILDVIETERDGEILERAVFALSQLPDDDSGPALMAVLQDSNAPREARRQALFWLAHEGDDETVAQLSELLTR